MARYISPGRNSGRFDHIILLALVVAIQVTSFVLIWGGTNQ